MIKFIFLFSLLSHSANLPQSFSVRGRFQDANGANVTGTLDVTFTIFDPTATCILYEEKQTSVVLTGDGSFNLTVGTPTGDAKRTSRDPGKSLNVIFKNTATAAIVPNGANCSLATGYTPAANENRLLRISYNKAGQTRTIDPDTVINMFPQAINTQTLEGADLTGLVLSAGNVNSTNLTTLVDGGDGSALHHHDNLYVRNGGSSFGIGTSTPAADIEIKDADPSLRLTATALSGATPEIDFYGGVGGATQRGAIKSVDNLGTLTFFTGTTQALKLDENQNAILTGSLTTAGSYGLGRYTNAQQTTLVTTLTGQGAAALGNMWANSDTSSLKFWDGSAVQSMSTGAGGAAVTQIGGLAADPQFFTSTNDTNVTLAISSSTSTHTFTLGWTGQLSLARGGTNANLTAVNGGVVYSDASKMQISTVGTADQILKSNSAGAPTWIGAVSTNTASTLVRRSADGSFSSGPISVDNSTTAPGKISLLETSTNGTDSVSLSAPASLAAPLTFTLPGDVQSGKYLTTDGSGNLSWGTPAGTGLSSLGTLTGSIQTLTPTNDTNLTLAIASSGTDHNFAAGWSGQLGLTRGGTNASNTAVHGGVVYSTSAGLGISTAGSSGDLLKSLGAAAPSWTTPTTNNTNSAVVIRDGSARAQFTDPSANQDVATKAYVIGNSTNYQFGSMVPLDGSGTMTAALLNKASIKLEDPGAGTFAVTLTAPTLSSNYTITLPTTAGTAGQALTTNGAGTLTWASPSASGITSLNAQSGSTQIFTNDTNVSITSSGTLHTIGWLSTLALGRGGSGADLSASGANGGVVYKSSASLLAVNSSGTSGNILTSNGTSGPIWFAATNSSTASSVVARDANGAFSSGTITIDNANTSGGKILLYETTSNGSNYTQILANSLSTDYIWTLPSTKGKNEDVLVTDGSGNLQWSQMPSAITTLVTADTNNTNGTLTSFGSTKDNAGNVNPSFKAGTTYELTGTMMFKNASSSTPDAQFKISFSSTPTYFTYSFICAADTSYKAAGFSTGLSGQIDLSASGATSNCSVRGYLKTNAAATVTTEWSQYVSNAAASTLLADSYLTFTPVTTNENPYSYDQSMWVWYSLDEASGNRLQTGGTASGLDLVPSGTPPPTNDSTNKLEGSAATTMSLNNGLSKAVSLSSNSNWTMGCWIRATNSPAGFGMRYIFGLSYASIGTGYNLGIMFDGTNNSYYCGTEGGSTKAATTSASSVVLNTWTHFICRSSTTANKIENIINGAPTGTAYTGTEDLDYYNTLRISYPEQGTGLEPLVRYEGQVDECFIAPSAFSDAQICHVCSCGIDGSQCTCNGTDYVNRGRNTSYCGSCTLPTNCSAAPP